MATITDAWHYKKELIITGSSAGAIDDYPVGIISIVYQVGTDNADINGRTTTLFMAGKCKGDFGDIRFTDHEGNILEYYMAEYSGSPTAYAKFWFKTGAIAQSAIETYYVYYGNPDAVYDGVATEAEFFYVKDYVTAVANAGSWGNRAYYSEMSKVQGPAYLSKLMWFKMSCLHQLGSSGNGCKIISYERVAGTTKWHTRHKSAAFTLVDGTGVKYDLTPNGLNLDMFCDASDYIGYYLPSNANYVKTLCNLDPASYATTSGEPTVCEEVTENYWTGGWWVNCGGCFRMYINPEPHLALEKVIVIPQRIDDINILGQTLKGIKDAVWKDDSPWVVTDIPAGSSALHHHLKNQTVKGIINTVDMNTLYAIFYNTLIYPADLKYAVDPDTGEKTKFSTDGNCQFKITVKTFLGTSYRFDFYDVRVETIQLQKPEEEQGGEAIWEIRFSARIVKRVAL